MIPYFNELLEEEKEELSELIQMLLNQTFILEKKYDKKTERFQLNRMYRVCERHFDFLRDYFTIGGLIITENPHYGVIALKSPNQQGDKLSKLTTIFILLLKLIFDEQMNTVSNSLQVYTTLNEIYDKLQLFRLWNNKTISITELRKTISVLRKYQIIELPGDNSELPGDTKIMIYPTVSLILKGQTIQGLIEQYQETEEDESDERLSGADEDLSEQLALH